MSFLSSLLNEFIDVIEWVDDSHDTIVWKFPRHDNAIKMGAKLTVRESQVAVFMNEGQIADVFGPGLHELQTQNMPILTTLKAWKYAFNSPFKADVYFVSTRQFTNQKWGTKNPIMLRDAEFGPVRLRAFGSYSFKVQEPKLFLQQVSATNPLFTVEAVNEQLRNSIVARGMDAVAQSKIPVLDLAANYNEMGLLIAESIKPDFDTIGVSITSLLVENISLPAEVEEALDQRSQMGILNNLGAYAQFQAANAMEKSAENSIGGNLGAAGMGLGVGAAMMNQVGSIFKPTDLSSENQHPDAAPLIAAVQYHVAKDGKPDGPYDLAALESLAATKALTKTTLVWTKGMPGWAAAGEVKALDSLFENEPPPLL